MKKLLLYIFLLSLCSCCIKKHLYAQEELGFNDKTQSWISHCSAIPAIKASVAVNLFIDDETNDANFGLYDRLWIFGLDASTSALQSIVNPSSTTAVVHGSPTFTAYQGYTGVGSSYIDMEVILSSLTNFTQNSSSYGAYLRVASQQGNFSDMGVASNSYVQTTIGLFNYTGNTIVPYNNENGSGTSQYNASSAGTVGLYVSIRTGATGGASQAFYVNNSSQTNTALNNSSGVPTTYDALALAANNIGTPARFTTHQDGLQFYASGTINRTGQYNSIFNIKARLSW